MYAQVYYNIIVLYIQEKSEKFINNFFITQKKNRANIKMDLYC